MYAKCGPQWFTAQVNLRTCFDWILGKKVSDKMEYCHIFGCIYIDLIMSWSKLIKKVARQ